MTVSEILKEAEKNKEELETQYHEENEELVFLDSFLRNNNINGANGICSLKLSDFLIAYMRANKVNISFDRLQEIIYSNKGIIDEMDSEQYFEAIKIILAALETAQTSEFSKILYERNDKITKRFIKIVRDSTPDGYIINQEVLSAMQKLAAQNQKPDAIMELFTVDTSKVMDAMHLVDTFKVLKGSQEFLTNEMNNDANLKNMNSREKRRLANKCVKKYYKTQNFQNDLGTITAYHQEILFKERAKKKERRKAMLAYDNLIKELPRMLQKEEITEYERLINKIPDATLRLEILKHIYMNNQSYYQSLEDKYTSLMENSAINYQVLLQEYGISLDGYDIESIMKNSVADTKCMLTKLNKIGIKNSEDIIEILATSNKDIVNEINTLSEKGILQNQFIEKHKGLFNDQADERTTLFSNLRYLEEKRINPFYFNTSQDTLLLDTQKLSQNIQILEDYNLLESMNKITKYDFLASDKLEVEIDNILELGFEKNLEERLNLLNYSEDKWQRLRLLKELNIPIETTDELEEVLTNNKFFVPDHKLSDYIYNIVPNVLSIKIRDLSATSESEQQDILNEFTYTERTYKIGNVIISKNKVKRNLNKLNGITMEPEERLLVGTISGSILNDEEYKSIKSSLNPKLTL